MAQGFDGDELKPNQGPPESIGSSAYLNWNQFQQRR